MQQYLLYLINIMHVIRKLRGISVNKVIIRPGIHQRTDINVGVWMGSLTEFSILVNDDLT